MRWRSITKRRRAESRFGIPRLWATGCGWSRSRTRMATKSISKALRMFPRRRSTPPNRIRYTLSYRLRLRRHGRASANDGFREALHLFELWAELEQDQVDACGFKLRETLRNLFSGADKP